MRPGGRGSIILAALLVILTGPRPGGAATPDSRTRPAPGGAGESDPRHPADAATGDTTTGPWNSARVLRLVRRVARARRGQAIPGGTGESELSSFRARAEGHVYYLFDPGELPLGAAPERRIARADQVAIRIRWSASGGWQQEMVGRRSRTYLPVDLRYHVDHLLVVMDHFGRRIRMGEGTEVRDVPHPASPGDPSEYEYRLVDSLEVRVPPGRRRLYRVEFRPREPGDRGAIGEMFVDGDRPSVARMSFTFTPDSYLDPRIDYITVDLQSALVEGRHWLPVLQETTVRRQLRWLDIPAGGTIRTRMRVYGYELNPDPPPRIAGEPRVVSRPDSVLAAYRGWRRDLLAAAEAGAEPEEFSVRNIRDEARELALERRLAGTSPLRLHLPDASHGLRARRAEGVLVGAGGTYDAGSRQWTAWAGHPFGRDLPELQLGFRQHLEEAVVAVDGCYRCLEDVGPLPAASGVISSFGVLLDGDDYTDPYFWTGASASIRRAAAGGHLRLGVAGGRVRPGRLVDGPWDPEEARPVRPVEAGELARLELAASLMLGRILSTRWTARISGEAATDGVGDFGYTRLLARLRGRGRTGSRPLRWLVRGALGAAGGRLPAHRLFLLGGRGTLPGYPFRTRGGSRLALLGVRASSPLVDPWLTLRVRLAAGWARAGGPGREATERLGVRETGRILPSAGLGLGLFWDLLRVDLLRGLDGGDWALELSVDPDFWPML